MLPSTSTVAEINTPKKIPGYATV